MTCARSSYSVEYDSFRNAEDIIDIPIFCGHGWKIPLMLAGISVETMKKVAESSCHIMHACNSLAFT